MDHAQEPSPMVPNNRFLSALPTRQYAGGEPELPVGIRNVVLDELLSGIESGLVSGIGKEDDSGEMIQQVGLRKRRGRFTRFIAKAKVGAYGDHVSLV